MVEAMKPVITNRWQGPAAPPAPSPSSGEGAGGGGGVDSGLEGSPASAT
jgi:hypothetical protein